MKTITLNKIKYNLKDYICAPDMVGLNIFALFSLTEKIGKSEQKETIQIIMDNMGELTKLCKRIVISPKIEEPRMALILGLFLNPAFMESFTESFAGLDELMDKEPVEEKKD